MLLSTGRHLSMLPIEPRLGKMLIFGAVFRCLDPVLTIAAACTSRDAFVMPMDKKQVNALGAQACSNYQQSYQDLWNIASVLSNKIFLINSDLCFISQLSEQARHKFAGHDFSDHMTTVRAYEAWQNAMKEGTASEFCWKNFLSMQTLMGIASLRRQFMCLLQESGFVEPQSGTSDEYSHDRDLVRCVICAALFPAVVSAVVSVVDFFSFALIST